MLPIEEVLKVNRSHFHRTLLLWEPDLDLLEHLDNLLAVWPVKKRPKTLWCHSIRTRLNAEEIGARVGKLTTHKYEKGNLAAPALGKTYDLLVMQDLPSPNALCQLAGTVRGGGAIVLALPCKREDLPSLRQTKRSQSLFNVRLSRLLAAYEAVGTEPQKAVEQLPDGDDDDLAGLVALCKTQDQAQALLKILDVLCSDQREPAAVFVSGDRGRGKSALLGLAAGAYLLLNERAKQPWPCEILFAGRDQQAFHFVERALKPPWFSVEVADETLTVSTTERRCRIRRVDPLRLTSQKSTILFVDEVASLPPSLLEKMFAAATTGAFHRLVMAGTCVGYEGTARSFQLKQMAKLEPPALEIKLQSPIRFNSGDPVEKFLQTLFCLGPEQPVIYPPLDECELFVVDKRRLFTQGESLLQQVFGLLNSAHYKNSPDDLQLVADSERHSLAVLAAGSKADPKVCVVLHLAQEGPVKKRGAGNLVPCSLYDQFGDDFWLQAPALRIVRIVTHPKCQGLGYGKRALQLLSERVCVRLDGHADGLLQKLSSVHFDPPPIYLCVSFGLTDRLANFWLSAKFNPVYVRSGVCAVTGEHSCIMVKSIYEDHSDWLSRYTSDFAERFSFQLRQDSLRLLPVQMCQQLLCRLVRGTTRPRLSSFQEKRLQSYCSDLADHNIILDLMPLLATVGMASFSNIQQSIFIGMGCQGKTIYQVAKELQMPIAQVRALLNRALRQVLKEHSLPLQTDGPYQEAPPFEDEIKRKRRIVADLDDVL